MRLGTLLYVHAGPSYAVDSACSSSLYALEHAYKSIRGGHCDAAVVGGCNLCLHPFVSLQFARLGVLSPDGTCKPFDNKGDTPSLAACLSTSAIGGPRFINKYFAYPKDEYDFYISANGYARSEAISVIYLQKAKDAKRIYCTVIHAKTNCDGYKEEGITYPSGLMQQKLMEDFYAECRVDPSTLGYIEAHGTGTKALASQVVGMEGVTAVVRPQAGDPEELNAIDKVFCKGRQTPLPIGSVKSNIGHSEPASGLCSIAKVVIAFEEGFIPPNLHYETPREGVDALEKGRLQVVSERQPLDHGLVGVNSFGFGGANCHVLLRWNDKTKVEGAAPRDGLPRLVVASGRTEEAVHTILHYVSAPLSYPFPHPLLCVLREVRPSPPRWDARVPSRAVESRPVDVEFVRLLHDVYASNIHGHMYRGFAVVGKDSIKSLTDVTCRCVQLFNESRPLWLVFSGMQSEWPVMSKSLLELPAFAASIRKLQKTLSPRGVDIESVLRDGDSKTFEHCLLSTVAITAVQVSYHLQKKERCLAMDTSMAAQRRPEHIEACAAVHGVSRDCVMLQIGLVDVLRKLGVKHQGAVGFSTGEIACAYATGLISSEQAILAAYACGLAHVESLHTQAATAQVGGYLHPSYTTIGSSR
ncbi:hypothetical protein PR048_013899 [Dryococelus australis]|uniref:Ketosynthase family 3 (KS3) domain-containing protein n=1 Tax=Dryococelus australis TaxID=614101 RepID=A0ABQ9HTK1_9NEOP|nr:hypothetical protein PR048_013899 [Dryococelus australis]